MLIASPVVGLRYIAFLLLRFIVGRTRRLRRRLQAHQEKCVSRRYKMMSSLLIRLQEPLVGFLVTGLSNSALLLGWRPSVVARFLLRFCTKLRVSCHSLERGSWLLVAADSQSSSALSGGCGVSQCNTARRKVGTYRYIISMRGGGWHFGTPASICCHGHVGRLRSRFLERLASMIMPNLSPMLLWLAPTRICFSHYCKCCW